ncbi:MAG: hypothetical protein AAFS11_06245, partial [Planctomycetota bacterium]
VFVLALLSSSLPPRAGHFPNRHEALVVVVRGSQVDGGKFYGQYNNILLGGPDDSSNTRGQFIPTTAVEQYGFELARWMGVPISEMDTVFPNVSRFLDTRDPATHLNILS